MKKITFCEHNLELFGNEVFDYVENNLNKDFDIKLARCLGECGVCYFEHMLDVHGKLLSHEDPSQLIKMIEKEVDIINKS